ncbi:MAG TPA: hypothetical protein VHY08_19440 [Bacillota bacterium]|nr:hypothetical protein [Bacillota bacterium]
MKRLSFFRCLFLTLFILFLCFESTWAAGGIRVIGELTQEKSVSSGTKYNGSFLIKNTGDTACKVRVYQTDYLFYANGTNIYGNPGSAPLSNAKWITLSSNYITVPVNETATVNYSVEVPQNKELRGTYWSIVMVEPVEDITDQTSEQKGKAVLGLKTIIRYGVQIVTNIEETGTRKIEFIDKRLINEKGKNLLQLDIKNSGERWLVPTVSVQLFDKDGKKSGAFRTEKIRIMPTCSVRCKIPLENITPGKYKALVIVDNGDQYVFGANYDLTIE